MVLHILFECSNRCFKMVYLIIYSEKKDGEDYKTVIKNAELELAETADEAPPTKSE